MYDMRVFFLFFTIFFFLKRGFFLFFLRGFLSFRKNFNGKQKLKKEKENENEKYKLTAQRDRACDLFLFHVALFPPSMKS